MAITNGTFDTNLTGWTISGDGSYSVVWESPGRVRIGMAGCSNAYMSQTFIIDQNTLKFDWITPSIDGWPGIKGWKITVGGVTIYEETVTAQMNELWSGTISRSLAPYIGQTATLEFRALLMPYGQCSHPAAQYYTYLLIDNVVNINTGVANFVSTPSGAEIWINNTYTGFNTPGGAANLSAGDYSYKLVKLGYADVTGTVTIVSNQTTNITRTFLGSVAFTTTPPDARIWIDGVDKGVNTPYTITGLTSGNYSYILRKTGRADATGTFTITDGQTTNVSATLTLVTPWYTAVVSNNLKASGDTQYCAGDGVTQISDSAIPPHNIVGTVKVSFEFLFNSGYYEGDSDISYDGITIPESLYYWYDGPIDVWTTFSIDTTVSGYSAIGFRARMFGYTDTTICIRNCRVYYDLIDGNTSFTSSPSGARIWIDNVDKSVDTPVTIPQLSAGNHTYKLTKAGYTDATGNFSTTVGTVTTVPLVTLTLAVVGGDAAFTSTPTGATIWIDDINTGQVTPYTKTGLTAGSHSYRLIKVGYTKRGNITIVNSQTTNVIETLMSVGLNGSTWVEDQYLCYINASNVATYVSGTSSGVTAGLPGSTWIEGTQLAYIDSSNNKRLLPVTTLGTVIGLDGSLWIDGNYLYYIASGIQRYVTI